MKKLTDRQFEAIELIYEGQEKGITPSLFELAGKLGVSSRQSVKDLLDAIARKGYLVREPRRARAILLKPKAIREIEIKKERSCSSKIQLNLGLTPSETVDYFYWDNPQNIIINYGTPSNSVKVVIDSSDIIPLGDQNSTLASSSSYEKIQLVAEKLNFDGLNDSTQKHFLENHDLLIVTPIIPFLSDINGYTIPDNHPLYEIVWSGILSNHYFRFGKEYGSTENIAYINNNTGQMRLFPISIDTETVGTLIQKMCQQLKSWSQYVDFPIYGGALKKTGEVLFWSRGTSRDINDLRYFFLVDITQTNFQSSDKILLRDVSYNFPKFINNPTQ